MKCPYCERELKPGFGMGNVVFECQCQNTLIWIPTLKGGHWEPFTYAHQERVFNDFTDCLRYAAAMDS